ncbi:MAG TPA: MarR family transcriptional regulator [Capsulimonadaceae bacterium]|nr:MarR family transcriptional regulator [Capsulimonadaceae bacterium]
MTTKSDSQLALGTYVKLIRAAESATGRIHRHLAGSRITTSQFGVLEALLHLGPLCQKDLAEKILKSSGNLTLVIDNLERQGLVTRKRSPEDRRFVTITLTKKGLWLIAELFPLHEQAVAREFSVLTGAEQEELGRLCRKLGKQEPD